MCIRDRAKVAIGNARRHVNAYLDLDYTTDDAERERVYCKLVEEAEQVKSLGPESKRMMRDETELMEKIEKARQQHEEATGEKVSSPTP